MKSTFSILFYLKKSRVNERGEAPLMVRITVNGDDTSMNANKTINPENWDQKNQIFPGRTNKAQELNEYLNALKVSLTLHYREFIKIGISPTALEVKNSFLGIKKKDKDDKGKKEWKLLESLKVYMDTMTVKLVNDKISQGLYNKYARCAERLSEYLIYCEEINKQIKVPEGTIIDINLNDLNYSFIEDFKVFLSVKYDLHSNTINKYIQRFKTMLKAPIKNRWIDFDPFVDIKIKFLEADRGFLDDYEIITILNKHIKIVRLDKVRDVYLFQIFTGLSQSDMENFGPDKIVENFDKKLWIIGKRGKTNIEYRIPLLEIPLQILKKYEGKLKNGKLLPVISNQRMNSYLQELADICGINKHLTTHLARHTFATTVTLAKGVPLETVQKMLGHAKIQTTQIYARITDTKIGVDMKNVSKKYKTLSKQYA